MLRFKRTGNVIEVEETLHGYNSTSVHYRYYNLVTWMKSSTGEKDAELDFRMDQGSIDWAKKHYLPRC